MVKDPKKPRQKQTNTINSVLTDNKPTLKSRQQIYQENYQKNKEKKKQQRRERYQQGKEAEKAKQKERYEQVKEKKKSQQKINYAKKKEQDQLTTKQNQVKYYGAESIKILMSLKEYTELNKEKRKIWLDFIWTLKDLNKIDISNIIEVMRIRELVDNLIRDYWTTAKNKVKKGKSWNSLDQDQKDRLIKYWGYEKARIENGYIDEEERLERQSQEYLKEIGLAKFHEQRGKIKCECGWCEQEAIIKKEVQSQRAKEIKDYEAEQIKSGLIESEWIKGGCNNCGEYKKVDSDSGLCKKCSKSLQ